MQLFMACAVVALFVVWNLVGVRLLLMARRTRGFPEFALGLGLLLQAGLGYPLSVAAQFAGSLETEVAAFSSLFMNPGCLLVFVFTARVFHGGSRLAWGAVALAGVLLAVHGVGSAAAHAAASTPEALDAARRFWGVWILAVTGAAWGWTGVESLRHYARMRKRVRLGLVDPVVCNRMALWGVMGSLAFATVVVDTGLLLLGDEVARTLVLPLVTSLSGLAISACMVLAFLPPRAYLEAVRRAAPAA